MHITRMTSKGQVVIPKPLRNALHICAGTEFKITGQDNRLILETLNRKAHRLSEWQGFSRKIKTLNDEEAFAPVELNSKR